MATLNTVKDKSPVLQVKDQSSARPGDSPSRKRMHRGLRAGCLLLAAPLWLFVAFLAAELLLRMGDSTASEQAAVSELIAAARAHDLEVYERTAPDAPRPPEQVNTQYPNPGALESAPAAHWGELADRWNAIVLACDAAGGILDRFVPAAPPALLRLAQKTAQAQTLFDTVADRDREMMQGAIDQALREVEAMDTGYLAPFDLYSRGFSIDLAPNEPTLYKYHFHGMPEEQAPPALAVAIVPSRFERGLYRPYAYQDALYPAYVKSEFWANGHGLRDEEVVQPKPAGIYRIICIGGSTTGEGPRNDLTYPNLLERRLAERYGRGRIEVVNAGIDGADIAGSAGTMPQFNALAPDLYIHYNYPNDVGRVMKHTLENGPLASPLHATLARWVSRSRILSRHARWAAGPLLPGIDAYRAAVEALVMPQIARIHQQATAAGAALALCSVAYPRLEGRPEAEQEAIRSRFIIPLPMQVELEDFYLAVDAFNEAIKAYCLAHGLLYIPTAENIDGGVGLFPDLCHLYIPGLERKAAIVAEAIMPLLEQANQDAAPVQGDGEDDRAATGHFAR